MKKGQRNLPHSSLVDITSYRQINVSETSLWVSGCTVAEVAVSFTTGPTQWGSNAPLIPSPVQPPHPLAHLLTADTAITHQFKAALWPRCSAGSLRFRGEGVLDWEEVGGVHGVKPMGSWDYHKPTICHPNNNQSEEINCLSKYQVWQLI